jgi:hypothetical protein
MANDTVISFSDPARRSGRPWRRTLQYRGHSADGTTRMRTPLHAARLCMGAALMVVAALSGALETSRATQGADSHQAHIVQATRGRPTVLS